MSSHQKKRGPRRNQRRQQRHRRYGRLEWLEPRIVFDATISGTVYLDLDGDLIRAATEDGVPGALITLTGSAATGESINITTLTLNDGSYQFPDVPTGTYSLTQSQPEAIIDGGANQITGIAVSDGPVVAANDFREGGLKAEYSSIIWFFASSTSQTVFREVVARGEEQAGNFDLAAAIRAGDTSGPVDENIVPVAIADTYSTPPNTELVIAASEGVLANDTDANGDPLTASLVTSTTNGTLSLDASGSFVYTPNGDFAGTDTFTYTASDGTANSNPAIVTITVQAENRPPVTVADAFDANEDEVLSIDAAGGLLDNDSDPDDDELMAILVTQASHGEVNLSEDGAFTYTPDSDFNGADSFTYEVSDGELVSNISVVSINVLPINDPPVAQDDMYSTHEDTILAIDAALGLLANDTDVEDDLLTAVVVEQPSHGSLLIGPDGAFTYTPDENFEGVDTFQYAADDGLAQSNPATVTIDVVAVDDPGTIVLPAEFTDPAMVATRLVGELISFPVSVVDVDDSDYVFQLDLEASGIPAGASLPTIDPVSGQFTWTPTATGRFAIRVIAVNGDREANQETFLLDVLPDNSATV